MPKFLLNPVTRGSTGFAQAFVAARSHDDEWIDAFCATFPRRPHPFHHRYPRIWCEDRVWIEDFSESSLDNSSEDDGVDDSSSSSESEDSWGFQEQDEAEKVMTHLDIQ